MVNDTFLDPYTGLIVGGFIVGILIMYWWVGRKKNG